MASTYTTNNGIELIGTGEQSGTWGDTTNTNFELIDASLDGQVSIELASTGTSGSPNTVAITDGDSSDGRNRMFIFTDGASFSGDAYVQLTPNDAEKIVYVRNNFSSSSPRSIILFQGNYNASNAYTVPRGKTAVVYFNGTGFGAVAANIFDNAHFDALNIVGNADVGGNLTVTGDVVAGDDVSLQSDGAVLNFGADDDVSLTHIADTAIRLNTNKGLQFRDATISIASSADGQLDIDADTEVEITTTTLDIDATTTNISGTLTASSITEGSTALASKYLGINANADSATKWQTARTITLTGDVSGTATGVDGQNNISIETTIQANKVALGTDTTGNYVQSLATTSPLSGGAAGSEGPNLTISLADAYGDTKNPFGSKSANLVLAGPNSGSSSAPSFRSLVAADIPTLTLGTHTNGNYVQSLATTSPLSGGASGSEGPNLTISLATAYGDTKNPFGSKAANLVLASPSSGSSSPPGFRSLVAADIPTLAISKVSGLQSALDGKLGSGSNAVSASKWQTARTITLGGDLSGSVSIDGQSNVTLNATVDNLVTGTTQDFKNSGNFKSYNFENFSAWGSSTANRRATYASYLSVWKDRYVLIGYINSSDTNNDPNFKVFDLETETMYTINTYSGSATYLERPYFLQNLDGSPCSTDGDSFFIVSGTFYFNDSRKKLGKVTATDSNPSNWTITYYGDSPYTTHSNYPASNGTYPSSTANSYRGYTISSSAVVKGNNIYCVAYYQYYANKYIGKLLKFDTSTNTLTETDILSLVEGAGWGIPIDAYNLDFYGSDRDPDRYIAFTLHHNTKIRGAAVYDITDNHFETTVQYNTLRGTSVWSNQGVSGPILPNGDIIICPTSSATSATDATVGIYNLNPNSAGFLEVDLKQGFGNDHDWTTTAFSYPKHFCDSKTFSISTLDYTSTNSAPEIFDTSSLSAKQFTRGNIGGHTSNVAFASGDGFITHYCPKPLSDGRRIVLQYRYDISYSTFNYGRARYSDKILTVFKPER